MPLSDVPVFILAGGLGTRLKEHTEFRPKPMVEVGDKPILWHIMRSYAQYGFRRFVVCAGFKAEVIKDYFLNFHARSSDFTVSLMSESVTYHGLNHDDDWEVTVADTGVETMTGGRIGRAAGRYLGDAEHFAVTYGDGVTDADLAAEFDFHRQHGKIGTLLGINPPSRFGELLTEGDNIKSFSEKPELVHSWINGGYFFFRREFMQYLTTDAGLVLEQDPLNRLASDGELNIYRHDGYWACMDTQRDKEQLEALWKQGNAPWAAKASISKARSATRA
ncbi:glucose-1-phosphate cytidylyltransferase [Parvibaculum indicum]|uniref:glucose-1-phosphate cytidylyltransferase n=1 Tax=Parvibaculum indicum TaxID=562969 RepID=UPI0014201B67|nr:glucose-1-phosphate cytidylyltransferase [Parvibaculum indicum]NIJ41449.1 glucose-1-phosphate cytidylyltransferase [Parvibaculum indicum]